MRDAVGLGVRPGVRQATQLKHVKNGTPGTTNLKVIAISQRAEERNTSSQKFSSRSPLSHRNRYKTQNSHVPTEKCSSSQKSFCCTHMKLPLDKRAIESFVPFRGSRKDTRPRSKRSAPESRLQPLCPLPPSVRSPLCRAAGEQGSSTYAWFLSGQNSLGKKDLSAPTIPRCVFFLFQSCTKIGLGQGFNLVTDPDVRRTAWELRGVLHRSCGLVLGQLVSVNSCIEFESRQVHNSRVQLPMVPSPK